MLPCMLPDCVTTQALDELVAYRRIKDRSSNICDVCAKEMRKRTKRCAHCGNLYSEEGGRISSDERDVRASLKELIASGAVRHAGPKRE